MFTFLDAVNQYLGYINFSPKLKGRIYTIVGGVATAYLLYAGVRFILNGVLLQGALFLVVGLLLLYFLFLNVVYFFTQRKAPFDISPKIEKLFRIKPRQPESGVSIKPVIDDIQNPRKIPLDGFYDPKRVLPAKVLSSDAELKNIDMIAHDMLTNALMTDNYAGLSEHELTNYLAQSRKPAYAICAGAMIPHFNLKLEAGQYVAYAGINQAHLLRVGVVQRVGLQSVQSISATRIHLFAAAAIMVGGNSKMNGRAGTVEQPQAYRIQMRIAFKQNEKA
ncbi:hypothetical protein MOO44_05115 [Nicoliella spurrieriana]|uniref:Uncharacterized protein n=1 Tax=Nicoliella spurrieriana TaxID=2925830 RepID=A0A976RR91_9LACO|nr:DUF6681 family protein [Nicoliella spurrieriana]UQS86306.1 hypothetical protein MOO44_05115 [Nicoliella spurrieriana]